MFAVDYSILTPGIFYIAVLACYLFFEEVVVNDRPILIDGYLEASYPSSTTLLVLCVVPTAMMQFRDRIQNSVVRRYVNALMLVFTVLMVIGRLVSGVHWLSDIVGGVLLSGALVMFYDIVSSIKDD